MFVIFFLVEKMRSCYLHVFHRIHSFHNQTTYQRTDWQEMVRFVILFTTLLIAERVRNLRVYDMMWGKYEKAAAAGRLRWGQWRPLNSRHDWPCRSSWTQTYPTLLQQTHLSLFACWPYSCLSCIFFGLVVRAACLKVNSKAGREWVEYLGVAWLRAAQQADKVGGDERGKWEKVWDSGWRGNLEHCFGYMTFYKTHQQ